MPAHEKTAVNGRWVAAPATDFFNALIKKFPSIPLIAEDLGLITDDVREVMKRFGFPGMKVLQFAFGEDLPTHPYLPHNYMRECVVYSGTHDNNTTRGWFEHDATPEEKARLSEYLGREISAEEVSISLIRLAMMSAANTVIFPLQDVLGLGAEARMNRPSTAHGNWEWRLMPDQNSASAREKLLALTRTYGRIPDNISTEK